MFVLVLIILMFQSPTENPTLKVVLNEVKKSQGSILICLCNDAETFMEDECFRSAELQAIAGHQEIVFEDLPRGSYALSVFHDENANGELDQNFVGLPKEPFGFSAFKGLLLKRPTFEQCSFDVSENQSISIKMR